MERLKRAVKQTLQPLLVPLRFLSTPWRKRIVLGCGSLIALLSLLIGISFGGFALLFAVGGAGGLGIFWAGGVGLTAMGIGARLLDVLWTRIRPASGREMREILFTPEVRSRLESAAARDSASDPDATDRSSSDVSDRMTDGSSPPPSPGAPRAEDSSGDSQAEQVQCENCYSTVDASASECPACGAALDDGWLR